MATAQDTADTISTTRGISSVLATSPSSWAMLGAGAMIAASVLLAAGTYAHQAEADRLQRQCAALVTALQSDGGMTTVIGLMNEPANPQELPKKDFRGFAWLASHNWSRRCLESYFVPPSLSPDYQQ